ncbi:MAG: 5-bromo-4-chloroindolyl phosphate hydrolysis family protein [Huintestinicola sp.]|uniref:5-bromo-4-chloroindolyl phosphate hydrolysis family protein n=1 Tax=Huintestinicola sp. TaxID=2981661 RepID=UPI003F0FEE89
MKNDLRQNIAAIISAAASGAVFLILLFMLEWSVFIDIPVAMGTYAGLYLLTKPKRRIGSIDIELIENGAELEQKLLEAKEDYESIKRSIVKIGDMQVKNEAEKLSETSGAIIEYLENNPDKIRRARQFIDYYQDCASKLLSKYIGLQDANIETAEIIKLKQDTRSALATLNKAFSGQFEKLMRGELTDMQAEIELLEQTVKMEMDK